MTIIKENVVTLTNEINETTIKRSIAIVESQNHFVVINVDEITGWSETQYVSKSKMFDNMNIATKWFDKLSKDANL